MDWPRLMVADDRQTAYFISGKQRLSTSMEIAQIRDRASLRNWLIEAPFEWSQAVAARAALKIAPLAFSVMGLTDKGLAEEHRRNLPYLTFRAVFISAIARKHPAADMRAAADAATAATVVDAVVNAAYANAAAANAAVDAVYAAADAHAAAFAASDAATLATAKVTAADDVWRSVRGDCQYLSANRDDDAAENARQLMVQPLWLGEQGNPAGFEQRMLYWIWQEFDKFTKSDLCRTTSFGLIADWYAGLVPIPNYATPFRIPAKAEIEIGQLDPSIWGDGDDNFNPEDGMDTIAKIAGWKREERNVSVEEDNPSETVGQNSASSPQGLPQKPSTEKIAENRVAVRVQIVGIIATVKSERENLGGIPNSPDRHAEWKQKVAFLDELEKNLQEVLDKLPVASDGVAQEEDEQAAEKLLTIAQEFTKWLKTHKPEMVDWTMRLGSASTFIGLMNFVGASMPIATSIVLAMTCGNKARDILLGKKAP